jgi:U3 small nucleolar RNA-associated protein 19
MIAVRQVADECYQQSQRKKGKQQTSTHLVAERLMQILMLIPLVTSQKTLDQNKNAFMFPAPDSAIPDDDESNVQDDSEEEDDDDDGEESSDDDNSSNDDTEEPRTKRQKLHRPRLRTESASAHAYQWSKAWLAVLQLDMPSSAIKNALQFLPTNVLPNVSNPLLFAEFFIRAYQYKGVTPILALDGLFILMTEHGLEYPDYYKQLYKLVTPTLFYVRYRTRFSRLLDRSISRNELLPAQTVAAFIKRLLRASLQSSPAGILTALALCSNWLRRHPETTVLVHAASTTPVDDPYDATIDDPSASQAIQSSLWELESLSRHYFPAVVTLAAAVGSPEQDKVPLLDMEDFYQQSYHNLFEQERKRQRKSKKTPLTFQPPKGLFSSSDVFSTILDIPSSTIAVDGEKE